MAPKNDGSAKKVVRNKGAWTAEEDQKLSQNIEIHGAKRWKTVAVKAGYYLDMYLQTLLISLQERRKKNNKSKEVVLLYIDDKELKKKVKPIYF